MNIKQEQYIQRGLIPWPQLIVPGEEIDSNLTKYTPSLRVWNQNQEITAQFDFPFMHGFTITMLANYISELAKWTEFDVCYPNS